MTARHGGAFSSVVCLGDGGGLMSGDDVNDCAELNGETCKGLLVADEHDAAGELRIGDIRDNGDGALS